MYVGGVIEPNLSHLPTIPNFRGCLENVFINGINVIDKAKREDPDVRIPRKVKLCINSKEFVENVLSQLEWSNFSIVTEKDAFCLPRHSA